MKDILLEIVTHKREEVARQKQMVPLEQLAENAGRMDDDGSGGRRSMRAALLASPTGIIAEFKRRSPSKGWIREKADVATVVEGYERAGAAALSVLTDTEFFGGSLADLRTARAHTALPILRKDFVVDEYQLYQARIAGADAVLLIAAVLDREQCRTLTEKAHALGLEVLLELHGEAETAHADCGADMIGVNNRHLGSFVTDVEYSFRMAARLPKDALWVSESGLRDAATLHRLRNAGFRGFLIGETFMSAPAPGEALAALASGELNK